MLVNKTANNILGKCFVKELERDQTRILQLVHLEMRRITIFSEGRNVGLVYFAVQCEAHRSLP